MSPASLGWQSGGGRHQGGHSGDGQVAGQEGAGPINGRGGHSRAHPVHDAPNADPEGHGEPRQQADDGTLPRDTVNSRHKAYHKPAYR